MASYEAVVKSHYERGQSVNTELRIMHHPDTFAPVVHVGVVDSLGNTEWVDLAVEDLLNGLREAKVIV